MTVQTFRTPKGLVDLTRKAGIVGRVPTEIERIVLLSMLQDLQNLYCAIWGECVWALVDATQSKTKFIISDHPVTLYNRLCHPVSDTCIDGNEPDIRAAATHTVFPLSLDRALILTNLTWVRNPYQHELRPRPNPNFLRPAMFNYTQIQTGRELTEIEVNEINLIIKCKAHRYIAAGEEEWLYPENKVVDKWQHLGGGYLLMPDPRAVRFTGEILIGYEDGADAFDEYGRKPGQPGFKDKMLRE